MPVGTVYVDASQRLVDDVNEAALAHFHAAKTATRVRQLPNGTVPVTIDSGAALKHIGTTSTPPDVQDAFTSASSWAFARYQWAFQLTHGNQLAATTDALDLRRHHAAVFSEHVGIGVGLTILEEVLRRRHQGAWVSFHDLDFVLTGARFDLRNGSARMADYLAEVTFPSGRTVLYVIECKGQTRPSRNAALDQLARGLTQVVGLTARGRDLPSYVIGTRVRPGSISVQVVDPPAPLVVYNKPTQIAVVPPPGSRQVADTKLDLPLEKLAARLISVRAGRVLAAAGDFGKAASYLGTLAALDDRQQGRSLVVDGVEIVGQTQPMTVLGREFTAVRGAATEAVDMVRDGLDYLWRGSDGPSATWERHTGRTRPEDPSGSAMAHIDPSGVLVGVASGGSET